MDEINLLRSLSNNLPKIKYFGIFGELIAKWYNRKERKPVYISSIGVNFFLEPDQCVDRAIIFYPQLWDHKEFTFLKNILKPGDTFIDLGANIGFYSLRVAQILNGSGRILSIEGDTYNYKKLCKNISLNPSLKNIDTVNIGVSDKIERIDFFVNLDGNYGGNSFVRSSDNCDIVSVNCEPLSLILLNNDIGKIDVLKIDIEGFEFKVLSEFFANADRAKFPKYLIIEYNDLLVKLSDGDVLELMSSVGYEVIHKFGMNIIAKLSND